MSNVFKGETARPTKESGVPATVVFLLALVADGVLCERKIKCQQT